MTNPNSLEFADNLRPEDHIKEMAWAKRIADCLDRHYPGYLWAVNVDLYGGMATIQSLQLSGEWGCYLKMSSITNDPSLAKVKQYGGEILERHRVSRTGANADQLAALQRNRLGNILADHT